MVKVAVPRVTACVPVSTSDTAPELIAMGAIDAGGVKYRGTMFAAVILTEVPEPSETLLIAGKLALKLPAVLIVRSATDPAPAIALANGSSAPVLAAPREIPLLAVSVKDAPGVMLFTGPVMVNVPVLFEKVEAFVATMVPDGLIAIPPPALIDKVPTLISPAIPLTTVALPLTVKGVVEPEDNVSVVGVVPNAASVTANVLELLSERSAPVALMFTPPAATVSAPPVLTVTSPSLGPEALNS